ncbi:hypothetical protein JB92DRAFT_3135810 [Gautieria morchelliformis]|nr:hypothetical protein JB92DRAFT_3135810 [Gautieria morchelliformis]
MRSILSEDMGAGSQTRKWMFNAVGILSTICWHGMMPSVSSYCVLQIAASGWVWGTDEVNIEGWKALKQLPGHESTGSALALTFSICIVLTFHPDVTDLAWPSDDRYLASVGLDSMVISSLFGLNHIKGLLMVCAGIEYLTTQSDDKTVKIWHTTDWVLEATIDKPFKESPGSTFFRHLSWSPDGVHLTASNAMNNKVAAVIAWQTWTSEISLMGHENTVEGAASNPHLFLRNPEVLKTGVSPQFTTLKKL